MPVSLPPGMLTPWPQRLVNRQGTQTTITRKSAQARIPGLTQGLTKLSKLAGAPHPAKAPGLTAEQTPRRLSAAGALQRRGTLDLTESLSDHDGSDSDTSYDSFISRLERKDVLRLDSQLRIDELLDRALSDWSINPSPTLTAS